MTRSEPLTRREIEILQFGAAGLTYPEIAARLAISEQTVANHLHLAYRKLGVGRLIEAMHALGWVQINGDAQRTERIRETRDQLAQIVADLDRVVDWQPVPEALP